MKLPMPEKRSFMTTISVELLLLIIFVQLFSNPQQIQAPNTQNAPSFSANAPAPSKLRIILAIVAIKIASHSFLDITSLKTTRAIMEVATISKLFSSGTLADQAWNPSFFSAFSNVLLPWNCPPKTGAYNLPLLHCRILYRGGS